MVLLETEKAKKVIRNAKKLDSYLTTKTFNANQTDERTIIVKTDGAPSWVGDIIHGVHTNQERFFPSDSIYMFIRESAWAIMEAEEINDLNEVYEVAFEIEPDIYTHDLMKWAVEHVEFLQDEDIFLEAKEMSNTIQDCISFAQYTHKQQIFDEVVNALLKLENRNVLYEVA
jgi:hypothetical protein